MPKTNSYLIPKENKAQIVEIREIENQIPSFEEFMKTYEIDKKVSESYDFEVDSHGDIRESKKSGPMFNFAQLFQVLLNTPAGPVVDTVARGGGSSPDVSRAVMETGKFIAEHSNEITQFGRYVGEYARNSASSSSSTLATTTSYVSDYRTLWDWWANGITSEERQILMSLGIKDMEKTYSLDELKGMLERYREREDLGFSNRVQQEAPFHTFVEKEIDPQFLEFKSLDWKDYVSREKNLLPEESKKLISEWISERPWNDIGESRVINPPKSESPVWKGLKYKGRDRYGKKVMTNGKTGSKERLYQWDNTHDDIEVFSNNGKKHLGSMDPMTGEIYKAAKGHTIDW